MTFEPDFLNLMPGTMTYEPFGSNDGYGNPSFGTSKSLPCHITYKTKALRSDSEQNIISTAQAQIPPPGFVVNGVTIPTVSVNDRVVLPDGLVRKVLNVTAPQDDTGIHHQSLDLT